MYWIHKYIVSHKSERILERDKDGFYHIIACVHRYDRIPYYTASPLNFLLELSTNLSNCHAYFSL
jgi:GH43 family beta-xylosidase